MNAFSVTGHFVDVPAEKIYPATIEIAGGRIVSIREIDAAAATSNLPYLLPGFTDSHVHIESSMLVPAEFARLAVVHGTVSTVSDPHEIANVCGIAGVEFMIDNGNTVPFKFNFGAPSCVPATVFETAGAVLNADDVETLLSRDEIKYLSEMMNFPGVLSNNEEVMKKIAAAHRFNKPVDGHAPGLRGTDAKNYIAGGILRDATLNSRHGPRISTDHECFTKEEALDKLQYGMKILIREGSAAKNFDALIGLLNDYPDSIMFCSDDKHPDSLVEGHINLLCARAAAEGISIFKIIKAACINPVLHYKLDTGLLQAGNAADFIVVKNIIDFEVMQTYINGELVADQGQSLIPSSQSTVVPINHFSCYKKIPSDFIIAATPGATVVPHYTAIEALDGQLITNKCNVSIPVVNGELTTDPDNDLLKIVVVNRYGDAPVAKAFIKNFGLKQGAIASSVAHDSHNIVAAGIDDESICKAVNMIIAAKGGVSCVKDNLEIMVPLPVAGLMSNDNGYRVALQYSLLDQAAKEAGCTLSSPFMTLSFMALLVIPHIKLSDLGLFDGDQFEFIAS